jgi:hypothetical protein
LKFFSTQNRKKDSINEKINRYKQKNFKNRKLTQNHEINVKIGTILILNSQVSLELINHK